MVHPSVIVTFKAITLGIGVLITYFSLRAYRRTGAAQLRALTIGFGVVTFGVLVAGIFDQLSLTGAFAFNTRTALVVESFFTMIGFAVILYSLYAE